jgi:hypothetical protein
MNAHKLGIWMDHMNAYLIEFSVDNSEAKTIHSKFTNEVKVASIEHGENKMHSKEQGLQREYYKALAEVLKSYSDILLFGPTDAKYELKNLLDRDNTFSGKKITVNQTDKMTKNQQRAFVKDFFHKHPSPLVL